MINILERNRDFADNIVFL